MEDTTAGLKDAAELTGADGRDGTDSDGLRHGPEGQAALSEDELSRLTDDIVAALKTVYDPEIPVDIYELGLIYKVDVDDERNITVDMTLTAPACPVAGEMPVWVENALSSVPGIAGVEVNMVFDPPWDPSRMSDEAKVALDMY